jgi:endonuclease/exonuclease/phosphatase family metal-dependent hydrolase
LPRTASRHFPSWQLDFELERELQAVARFVGELTDSRKIHTVLVGDLDADPAASSIRFWTGHHALGGLSVCFRDAWESAHPGEDGSTFTTMNPLVTEAARDWPFQRIDYIFVRCGEHAGSTLQIHGCSVVFEEPVGGVWPSDHFGVVADLGAY